MRQTMPLRWIEDAEERRVEANALFQQMPGPSSPMLAMLAHAPLLARLSDWPAMAWLPALQAQSARCTRPHERRCAYYADAR